MRPSELATDEIKPARCRRVVTDRERLAGRLLSEADHLPGPVVAGNDPVVQSGVIESVESAVGIEVDSLSVGLARDGKPVEGCPTESVACTVA